MKAEKLMKTEENSYWLALDKTRHIWDDRPTNQCNLSEEFHTKPQLLRLIQYNLTLTQQLFSCGEHTYKFVMCNNSVGRHFLRSNAQIMNNLTERMKNLPQKVTKGNRGERPNSSLLSFLTGKEIKSTSGTVIN